MKNTLSQLHRGFESSSGLTPEFKAFTSTFKKEFKKELTTIKATDIEFSRGHFDISGFFRVGEQLYYFSLCDVRGMIGNMQLLYRTAEHNKDWTGGYNQYVEIGDGMVNKMNLSVKSNEIKTKYVY